MADDIVTRLRNCGDNCDCDATSFYECVCKGVEWPNDVLNTQAADEIERLRAELEQANINQQHARTGQASLDLEREQARNAHLRNAFAELADLCQRLLTERFNDMTEGRGDTPTPTPTHTSTRIDL